MSEDDEIAMLRAKKNVVVVARLCGQMDYDKARRMEAELDAAIVRRASRCLQKATP